MIRPKLIVAWLAFAGAGLYLLGAATPLAAPQGPQSPPPKLSRHPGPIKRTWHSSPATTPPQTEVVLPPRDVPPPAKSQMLVGQAEEKKLAGDKPAGATSTDSGFLTRPSSPSARVPASTPNAVQRDDSNAPIAETQRIRVELERLRDDAGTRRAFYDDLRRTVERVRAGQRDEVK